MATDASRPAVSWLKFEPKVSNFPATKTATAILVASAIMRSSLFFVFLFIFTSVCEGCPVYVAGVAPVGGGVWEDDVCLA